MIERRSFLKGLSVLFIAPAIVRASSLMPVHEMMPSIPAWCPAGWLPLDGREIKKKFYPDLYNSYQRMRFPLRLEIDRNLAGADFEDTPSYSHHLTSTPGIPRFARIVSARDLQRPNGELMRAGVHMTIPLPDGALA